MQPTRQTRRDVKTIRIAPGEAKHLPHDTVPDATWAFMRDGYEFISKRCKRHRTDAFRTRLMLQNVVCMQGEAAARVFYDTDRFQRKGATPVSLQKTLFGEGGVQGMDGDAHRVRKQMFMSALTDERIRGLSELVERNWRAAINEWDRPGPVVLFDEVVELLTRAVCEWSGVALREWEVKRRCRDIVKIVEGAGSFGLSHWQARAARGRLEEEWIGPCVEAVRLQEPPEDDERVLQAFSWHRDADGTLPDKKTVTVEVLNVIRPTVAVAYYVTFCALALEHHPQWRRRLQEGDDAEFERFVEEVRRYYPLFPFVAAVVREDFEWSGYRFPKGQKVLLDIYGTNHHPDSWGAPEKFHPDRFRGRDEGTYDLIPQGGGDARTNHRCPGDPVSMELMKVALRLLTRGMTYDVPRQNLKVDLSKIPTKPKSGFVMENVKGVE